MQSLDTTPRFRNLSINGTPRFISTSFSFNDKEQEENHNPEKECFMCRQANVYIKPIGMQQERRVARRHPPPLSRAQIEELSQKKHLTKREARTLLQCYFPEIKNVKYFQLHKYHSCCYDPRHLNLCKNHITAFQHERERYPNHQFHKHERDEEHFKEYERDGGQQNRVSFVRIKIEPTKGIPTRFLGPTALPESLADMLIKQVNRIENKKKLPSFSSESQSALEMHNLRKLEQPYGNGISRLSEHLATLDSNDDDDDDDDDDADNNNNNNEVPDNDNKDSDEDNGYVNTPNSNIRGYHGKVMDQSRMTYEEKLQTKQEKEREKSTTNNNNNKNGDLVVEDIDDLTPLFVHEQDPTTPDKNSKGLKKKKRKKRTKKPTNAHHKPKLNHWEVMALDQSQQESCGCRHHVRRLEADQVVYDWCRCKDHSHKGLKLRRKSIPPPPPAPPSTPPPKPPKLPKSPKPPKVETKTVGINATERTTTELALAYDPTAVDYDVIQEVLYYRTSSGRLVKPEINNAFGFNNVSSSKGHNLRKSVLNKSIGSPRNQLHNEDKRSQRSRLSIIDSPILSHRGSVSNGQTLVDTEITTTHEGIYGLKHVYEWPDSLTTKKVEINELKPAYESPDSLTPKKGGMYGDDDDEDDDDDEEAENNSVQFMPPKYAPESPVITPIQSTTVPLGMQKSSKPTYKNQRPTPNFERESSLVANRRWFDQALGDQNLSSVHDGRYGLIAGSSVEQYEFESQLPDNDYVEPNIRKNRSNCTIS